MVLTDGRRLPAEARPPEVVRDDRHDRLAAGRVASSGSQEAAERRPHAERRKVVAGDEQAEDPLGAASSPRVNGAMRNASSSGNERRRSRRSPYSSHETPGIGTGFRARLDEVKRAGVGHAGQRPQHDRLDPREDRRVHADADAERHDDDRREHRHLADRPPGVAQVHGVERSKESPERRRERESEPQTSPRISIHRDLCVPAAKRVGARLGVDLDLLPLLDEERHVNLHAGLEDRDLGDAAAGGVAARAGLGRGRPSARRAAGTGSRSGGRCRSGSARSRCPRGAERSSPTVSASSVSVSKLAWSMKL